MKNRTPVCFLTVLLAAALTVGCAQPADTPGTETTADTAAVQTTAAQTLPAEYDIPTVDYGGAVFTIAAVDYYTTGANNVWKAMNYCEVFSFEENGDPLNDAIYQRNRAVSEELNITIELYSLSALGEVSNEFRKLVMAAEDVVDLGMINAQGLPNLMGTGALVDLLTLPNIDFSHSWWDQNSRAELTMLDKMYAVTGDISLYISFAPISYFFNKQLVETLGLEDPYTLVREGQWTLDKAIALSAEAAHDLNGDGTMTIDDRYGMLCESNTLTYAVHACGVSLTDKDADGLPVLNVDVERATALTETMVPFMNDKNVTLMSNYQSGYNNTFTELFMPMFRENRALFFSNQLLVALDLRNMDADFGILPPPKLDETQEDYMCSINDHWGTFIVMPVTNTEYEMTGHVVESMGFWGQQLIKPAFIDTTVRDKALRDEDSSEMIDIILNNRVYDLASFYNWGSINTMFASLATSPNKQYASELARIEKKTKALIEKTITALQEDS
ncbi:MAG: hypothetical protein IJ302_09785 [Clostridia bacterium]|nr:hypothetical protein [Clostridia bacterium]